MSAIPVSFPQYSHAGIKYLADRGITPEIAVKLGVHFISHAEANDLLKTDKQKRSFYPKRDAIWIPTKGPTGLLHPYHGQAIFFSPGKKPFKRHTETTDEYPNEVNYLLAKALVEGDTVYWCESTIKAAILCCYFGLNAIGMNGVFGYSKGGGRLVNSTKELPDNLIHVLITDSLNDKNKKSLTSVLNARRRWRLALKQQLTQCSLRYIELPKPSKEFLEKQERKDKADWGIDDIYVYSGAEAVTGLLLATVEFHDGDGFKIWFDEFNSKFVYVKSISKVYDRDANQFLSKQAFFDNYASCNVADKPVAQAWFKSVTRPEVASLTFQPGEPEIIKGNLNIWQGFDIPPHRNTVVDNEGKTQVQKYWVDTIYDTFGKDGKYLIEQAAALVQFPAKRFSRFLLLGGKQGTGKNYAVEPLVRIFGPTHCQAWSVANFINNFNVLHRTCRLGILNEPGDPSELQRGTLVDIGERLKKNADQNERFLQLEPKGVDIAVVDRLQFNIVITNYGPPFDLQPSDRRCIALLAGQHMAIEATNNRGTKSAEYWAERWNWLNYDGGANEIMAYLLDYDLTGVDLDGPAPMTAYKALLLKVEIDTAKAFAEQLNADPLAIFQKVLGSDFRFREPTVFDAQVVARLFEALVRPIDRYSAFTTSVGKCALSSWECSSVQISARSRLQTGPTTIGARVYAIVDNRICEYKSTVPHEIALESLAQLKQQIALVGIPSKGSDEEDS